MSKQLHQTSIFLDTIMSLETKWRIHEKIHADTGKVQNLVNATCVIHVHLHVLIRCGVPRFCGTYTVEVQATLRHDSEDCPVYCWPKCSTVHSCSFSVTGYCFRIICVPAASSTSKSNHYCSGNEVMLFNFCSVSWSALVFPLHAF